MRSHSLLRRLAGVPRGSHRPGPIVSHGRNLRFEPLEGRRLLSATPQPLFDARIVTESSFPSRFLVHEETAFYAADDGIHGVELWRTDGTEAGTFLVKDISPQPGSDSNPKPLVFVGHSLWFSTADGLWRTDGTEEGTVLVKELRSLRSLVQVGDTFLFTSSGDLWKTDGTEAGTAMVRSSTWTGIESALSAMGETVFFVINDGIHGRELWKSDGTTDGTVLLKDISPGEEDSHIGNLTVVADTLFFTAYTEQTGRELWRSDGTEAGTTIVKDILPGPDGSRPGDLMDFDGTLLFLADDGTHGRELWRSDGTEAGTVLLGDLKPGSASSMPKKFVRLGGTLLFEARDEIHGPELFRTDGTEAGTSLVKDICPGEYSSYLDDLTVVAGTLFFVAGDGIHGAELWKSDGTPAGTVMVADYAPGEDGTRPDDLTAVQGNLYFESRTEGYPHSLVVSDGTEAGTREVYGFLPREQMGMYSLGVLGNRLLFSVGDRVHGAELWISDGTEAGTRMVKDVNTTPRELIWETYARSFVQAGATIYFAARDPVWGSSSEWSVFRTDGTPEGTTRINIDVNVRSGLTVVDEKLFFTDPRSSGSDLYVSDGTEAGTTLVQSLWRWLEKPTPLGDKLLFYTTGSGWWEDGFYRWGPHVSDGTPEGTVMNLVDHVESWSYSDGYVPYAELAVLDGVAYFRASDDVHGVELWKTDGTPEGTAMVVDIAEGPFYRNSTPRHLIAAEDVLYFAAWAPAQPPVQTPAHALALFKTDGTAEGTTMVRNRWNMSDDPQIVLATVGNDLYFFDQDDSGPYSLFRTDGTPEGTEKLADVAWARDRGRSWGQPVLGNNLLFLVDDWGWNRDTVEGLYRTDGTPAGTVLVKEIDTEAAVGPTYSDSMTAIVDGRLFFVNRDEAHGTELWVTDGTEAGTVLYADLAPGEVSSVPAALAGIDGKLYFAANHVSVMQGPWFLDPHVVDTDAYAGNDSPQNAFDLSSHPRIWLSDIAGPGIQAGSDWFRIDVDKYSERLTVELTHSFADGDINLEVVDPLGNVYDAAVSMTDDELLDTVLPASGTWLLRVTGAGRGNEYDLRWSTQYVHPGDANLDGQTDLSDFNLWNAHKFREQTTWQQGDFNGDGATDLSDFNLWNAYRFTAGVSADASAPDAMPAELATALDLELSRPSGHPGQDTTAAERAVDALLATCW